MASVLLSYLLPAAAGRAASKLGRLPKTTLAARGLTVTVDVVAVNGQEFSNLASAWEEVERPGRMPLLEYAGEQLARMRWRVLHGVDPEVSIERDLGALRNIAMSGERVVLTRPGKGTPFSLSRRGGWTITGMDFRPLRRRFSDNAISRAEIDLTFTEWSPLEVRMRAPSSGLTLGGHITPTGSTAPGTVPNLTGGIAAALGGAPQPRRHTVKAGETLSAIAVRYYGNANMWMRIADANGIRDPKKLAVGTVLTLP